MASENNQQTWAKISSKETVDQMGDTLIVIIFNKSTVPRFDTELALKDKRQQYEDSNNVKFFKYTVRDIDAVPPVFNVKEIPTYIFYRNGKEYGHLQQPKEAVLFAELDKFIKQKQDSQN